VRIEIARAALNRRCPNVKRFDGLGGGGLPVVVVVGVLVPVEVVVGPVGVGGAGQLGIESARGATKSSGFDVAWIEARVRIHHDWKLLQATLPSTRVRSTDISAKFPAVRSMELTGFCAAGTIEPLTAPCAEGVEPLSCVQALLLVSSTAVPSSSSH
jgi:hypothetical protein